MFMRTTIDYLAGINLLGKHNRQEIAELKTIMNFKYNKQSRSSKSL